MAEKLNHIRLAWAGGTHWFAIEAPEPPVMRDNELAETMARLRGYQKPHIIAPLHDRAGAVLKRLVTGYFGYDDVAETVRCGLIGGGDLEGSKPEHEWDAAATLIKAHVSCRPLAETMPLAQTILFANIYGVSETIAEAGKDPVNIPMTAFTEGQVDG